MFERLCAICSQENVFSQESMKLHTTFRVGGQADFLVTPSDIEQFRAVLMLAVNSNIPYYVIGNGSNLLVSDQGIRGIVIQTTNLSKIDVRGTSIVAQCGVSLAKLSKTALANSLEGLAFAAGIPGTVGGGVMMNAGAYGGQIGDLVVSSTYCMPDGSLHVYAKEEHDFSYRHSVFMDRGGYVLETTFQLRDGDFVQIQSEMADYQARRKEKQPLSFLSAGSTFKRPDGYFAGKLIEDAGLKGFRIGDAQVSEQHAGFLINLGNATANDIYRLILHCQKTVYDRFHVRLEPEVRMIGEFERG